MRSPGQGLAIAATSWQVCRCQAGGSSHADCGAGGRHPGRGRAGLAARAVPGHAADGRGRRRCRARRLCAADGRLRQLPHRCREQGGVPGRRPVAADAVRHVLHLEPHARPRDRHRRLVDRRLRAGDDQGRLARGPRLLSGLPLHLLRQHDAAGSGRPQGLSRHGRAGRQPGAAARARFPVQLPAAAETLEGDVLPGERHRARPRPVGELESRRLSRGGADPLRRVSHAEEPARRAATSPAIWPATATVRTASPCPTSRRIRTTASAAGRHPI